MTTTAPPGDHTPVPAVADERESGTAVELDPADMSKVVNRLKRAQGQLAGVVRMLEDGRDCGDVVTQLSAVSKAIDRAGFAIIASGMKQCLAEPEGSSALDVGKLQKLFLSLA